MSGGIKSLTFATALLLFIHDVQCRISHVAGGCGQLGAARQARPTLTLLLCTNLQSIMKRTLFKNFS